VETAHDTKIDLRGKTLRPFWAQASGRGEQHRGRGTGYGFGDRYRHHGGKGR